MIKESRGENKTFALMYMYNSSSPILFFNDTKGGYEEGNQLALFKSDLMKRTQNLVDRTAVLLCIQYR